MAGRGTGEGLPFVSEEITPSSGQNSAIRLLGPEDKGAITLRLTLDYPPVHKPYYSIRRAVLALLLHFEGKNTILFVRYKLLRSSDELRSSGSLRSG